MVNLIRNPEDSTTLPTGFLVTWSSNHSPENMRESSVSFATDAHAAVCCKLDLTALEMIGLAHLYSALERSGLLLAMMDIRTHPISFTSRPLAWRAVLFDHAAAGSIRVS